MDWDEFFPGRFTITSLKAFDSTVHISLIYALGKLGIKLVIHFCYTWWTNCNLWSYLIFHQINSRCRLKFPKVGICHQYPLLFNLFINTGFINIPYNRILLIADDTKMFFHISSKIDCEVLQLSINSFVHYFRAVGLNLKIDKCKVLYFYPFLDHGISLITIITLMALL